MNKGLNVKTAKHLLECIENREKIEGPRIGDYVYRKNGELERICTDYGGDTLQTYVNGSFALSSSGHTSYSGTCGEPIKRENLKTFYVSFDDMTGARGYPGRFWICYDGRLQAACSVYVEIECRVYREI